MSRCLDIKPGDKFSRLTIIKEIEAKNKKRRFLCKCDCGIIKEVALNNLRNGDTKSCGCLHSEITRERNYVHGHYGTRIHSIWRHMVDRCQNPHDSRYAAYGGREIKVCDEWQVLVNFYNWAIANGYQDDLTIERIDVNGDYCPDNCIWATWKQQQNNRRNNHKITFNGITLTLSQWAGKLGITPSAIHYRLNKGWGIKETLTAPKNERVKHIAP